ncbi:hypothetical protein SteCoe_37982 [Stentor coeruleus]|uniref:Uncharacterized protein n=1 Tax=Stentor coeruleus TaxID=5963 RepID=A0A1R2AM41_9CILI|nr:hypothetical protein SteCoe_37982 [Stentor coeruleus]
MSMQSLIKYPFKSNLLPEISSETIFKGKGHFILACSVSILETLVRFSIQPSQIFFSHIKRTFESLQENVYIYANHYKYYQQTKKFFSIISELTNNKISIIEKLQSLHFYASDDDENARQGLEKGMKMLTSVLFADDVETINAILLDNETDRIDKILTRLSGHFKVKFKVIDKGAKREFAYFEDDIPIIYLRYELGESAILYAKEMIELENLPNFRYERLEKLPFMIGPKGSQGNFNKQEFPLKQSIEQNSPLPRESNYGSRQIQNKSSGYSSVIPNQNLTKICHFQECSQFPLYTCSCSGIQIGVCQEHLKSHVNLKGNHQMTNKYKSLPETKKNELKSTLKSKIDMLKENKNKAIRKNKEVIKDLNKNLKKYLIMINMSKKGFIKALKYLEEKHLVSNDNDKTDADTEIFILKNLDLKESLVDLDFKDYELNIEAANDFKKENYIDMVDKIVKTIFENGFSDPKLENKPESLYKPAIPKDSYPNEKNYDTSPIVQNRGSDILQFPLSNNFPKMNFSKSYIQGSDMPGFQYSQPFKSNSGQMQQIPSSVKTNYRSMTDSAIQGNNYRLCQYENKYVEKDNFSEIVCPKNCSVCTKCRILDFNQCIICKRYYSEYQIQILKTLSESSQ